MEATKPFEVWFADRYLGRKHIPIEVWALGHVAESATQLDKGVKLARKPNVPYIQGQLYAHLASIATDVKFTINFAMTRR